MALKRTKKAIEFVSMFIPSFRSATETTQPLWGVQQIPGGDPDLRASQISFEGDRYARAEIVKASTAIAIANTLIQHLKQKFTVDTAEEKQNYGWITRENIESKAEDIAVLRKYPP